MADDIEASLGLDLSPAESALDEFDTQIGLVLADAAEAASAAMAVLAEPVEMQLELPGFDDITTGIDEAVAAAETETGQLVIPGMEDITSEIEEAVDAADMTTEPLDIDVGDGFDQAQQQIEGVSGAADQATSSLDGMGLAAGAVGAIAGGATGSTGGLVSMVGRLSPTAMGAAGALLAGAGAIKMMTNEAIEALGAQQRFNSTLGKMADEVEHLKLIEGLNTDLSELAMTLGSDDDIIRVTAARLFEMATASGKAKEEASLYTQQMIALGARAVALNPQLGDVGSVTDRLSVALVRGGRFAAKFGLDMNQAEITARALEMTGKDVAKELTYVEKAMAGAAIATEKYGGNLAAQIVEGSKNVVTIQRRLRQEIRELIEEFGTPLIVPLFDIMEAAIPVAGELGRVLMVLARGAMPLLSAALKIAAPLLTEVADLLEAIPTPIYTVTAALIALNIVLPMTSRMLLGVAANAGIAGGALTAVAFNAKMGGAGIASFGAGMAAAAPQIAAVVAATWLAGKALDALKGSTEETEVEMGTFTKDTMREAGLAMVKLDRQIEKMVAEKAKRAGFWDFITFDLDKVRAGGQQIDAMKFKMDVFNKVLKESPQYAANFIRGLVATGQATEVYQAKLDKKVKATAAAQIASEEHAAAVAKEKAAIEAAKDPIAALTKAWADAQAAASRYSSVLTAQVSPQLGLTQAWFGFWQQQEAVNESLREGKGLLDAGGEATAALILPLGGLVNAAIANAQANFALNQSQDQANAAFRETVGVIEGDLTRAFKGNLDQVAQWMLKLGVLPQASDQVKAAARAMGIDVDALSADFQDAGTAMADDLPAKTKEAIDGAKEELDRGQATLEPVARAMGVTLAGAFTEGFRPDVRPGLEPLPDALRLWAAFGGWEAVFVAAKPIGDAVASGIAEGIRASTWKIADAAIESAQKAVTSVKGELRISSPSKVFMEIGEAIPEGMALGITAGAAEVANAAASMFTAAGVTAGGTTGGGGSYVAGETSVALVQHFHGPADPQRVKRAARDGVKAGLEKRKIATAARVI